MHNFTVKEEKKLSETYHVTDITGLHNFMNVGGDKAHHCDLQ